MLDEGILLEGSVSIKVRLSYFLPILGGITIIVISIYEALFILSLQGQSILHKMSLSSPMKTFVSTYLFLSLSSLTLTFLGSYIMLKGYTKTSAKFHALSSLPALMTLLIPSMYGFYLQIPLTIGIGIGIALILSGAVLSFTLPPSGSRKGPLLKGIEVVTTFVFSALYAFMVIFNWQIYPIPSPTGGYIRLGDSLVFVAALLLGYKVGGLVGALGAVLGDRYLAYPLWYVSILAHGLEGLIPGLAREKPLYLQIVASGVGGVLMVLIYFFINVFTKGYPVAILALSQDLFGQVAVSMAIAIPLATIIKKAVS